MAIELDDSPSPATPDSFYYGDAAAPHPVRAADVAHSLRRAQKGESPLDSLARSLKADLEERKGAIGGVDNLWNLMTDVTDTFNPVCTSIWTTKEKVTHEMVVKAGQGESCELALTHQGERFPRYRQRLENVGHLFHGARFVDDPDFNLDKHIRIQDLPGAAGRAELNQLASEFIAENWDRSRPLWDMVIVNNYRDDSGGVCAVVARAHHVLADGQGMALSQFYMTSYFDELEKIMDDAAHKLNAARRGLLLPSEYHKALKPLDRYASGPFAPLLEVLLLLFYWLATTLSTAVSMFLSTYQIIRIIGFNIYTFWRVDHLTGPQHGRRAAQREVWTSKLYSMQDVKLIQQAFSGSRPGNAIAGVPKQQRRSVRSKHGHVTLNDVVSSIVADVLGKAIAEKPAQTTPWEEFKQDVNKVMPAPLAFFIPMSLREPGDWSMRNLSTGCLTYLYPCETLTPDVSARTLHAHIHRSRRELSLLKHSMWPKLLFHACQFTGQLPVLNPLSWFSRNWAPIRLMREWVVTPFVDRSLSNMAAVLTNVPGPRDPITLFGVEMLSWQVLPPQAGTDTLAIGIMTYRGQISIAISADKVPSSEGVARRLCESFNERFELYVARAREVLDHQD